MTATLQLDPTVEAFAAGVRAALSDLSAEDIDDLTGGLEADLSEKALDEDLGDPVVYAEELRSSAGLRPRQASQARPLLMQLRVKRAALAADIRSSAAASGVLDFLVSLRPFWWVLRAWLLYQLLTGLSSPLPNDPVRFFVACGALVLSVQWGRGKWLPKQWLRVAKIVVSVIALLVLPFAANGLASSYYYYHSVGMDYDASVDGLLLDGQQVSNIFAYDSTGQPLTQVQLFDQTGKPLSLFSRDSRPDYYSIDDLTVLVPTDATAGRAEWNVFPLQSVTRADIDAETGRPDPNAIRESVRPPFVRVRPLVVEPTPSAVPTPPAATPAQ